MVTIFFNISVFAGFDRDSYLEYKKTTHYKVASQKEKRNPFTDLHATLGKDAKALYWGLSMKKIEDLTGTWADIGAIAKANHDNFVYITLTPVLKDLREKQVYKCTEKKAKILFGTRYKVSFKCNIPSNLIFSQLTVMVGLITDTSTLNKKVKKVISKEKLEIQKQKQEQYRKEVQALNESAGLKEILNELKEDKLQKKEENVRQASSSESCLGYLKAMNNILEKDNERIKPTDYGTIESLESTKQSLIATKQANVYANKYQKYNCRKYSDKSSSSKRYEVQNNYSDIIMNDCQKKWNTDYSMVEYCVKKQTKAYNSITSFPNNIILRQCKEKWNTDYSMVKYCYEKQAEAKRNLSL